MESKKGFKIDIIGIYNAEHVIDIVAVNYSMLHYTIM